jgi:two-component system OmpR family response regulator
MARILIVDDNAPVRLTLTTLLRSKGHIVEQAANGQQALGRCESGQFDLILMDIYAPAMNGIQACQQLRRQSKVPILMLSPLPDQLIQDQVYECGATALIPKPLNIDRLLSWVGKLIPNGGAVPSVSPAAC